MKRYILFAGCNGVGKSTLYQTNDVVEVFDNTDAFARIARFEQGKCVLRAEKTPEWVSTIIV